MEKSVEYYMSLPYKMVVVEDAEGIYTAYFPDLPGCITCGDSPDEVFENARDAKRCWFTAAIKDGYDISEPSDVMYSQVC